ncbi:MAG: hypothetical protein CVU84_05630 [Firmicutes bacterium HGW-Firmicutes-1]|jgi:hypothetical protein|nr:MAG: hypothetical protein CVU84_05630 [Firmicutes bacterium HGW-Firmicutes-1]
MSDKNMEMMKKLIEEKKRKSLANDANVRPDKNIGKSHKAFINKKTGGALDK